MYSVDTVVKDNKHSSSAPFSSVNEGREVMFQCFFRTFPFESKFSQATLKNYCISGLTATIIFFHFLSKFLASCPDFLNFKPWKVIQPYMKVPPFVRSAQDFFSGHHQDSKNQLSLLWLLLCD